MRRNRSGPNTEMAMDITPMIDVVFQLIIFFMLIIDLTQKELEDIKLPSASECSSDEDPDKGRMIINISKDGKYIHKRNYLDLDQMRGALAIFRQKYQDLDDADGNSTKPILVRADEITRFKHVQKVMQLCGEKTIRIWKVELAAAETGEDEDKAGKQ